MSNQDNKQWHKLVFKQIQPIHIGAGSYGVINETRIFIPGWTMWGALTKAYNLQNGGDLSANQDLFENISCLYPCFDKKGENVLFPHFEKGEFYLDNYSERAFRAKFVDTFTSTAIIPGSRMAKDESLHEIDVILPGAKKDFIEDEKEKQTYWVGIISFEDDKFPDDFLKQGLEIFIGGDVRYGLGLIELVKIINIKENEDEFNKFKSANYLLVNEKNIESKIELLVELQKPWGKNELQVKARGFYFLPRYNNGNTDSNLKKGILD